MENKKDSLSITKNEDGTYLAEWDKNDPTWKFLNHLTSKQIQVIMEHALEESKNTNGT